MTTTFGDGKAAPVVAHPGHELCVYGWLEQARPLVFVLTDCAVVGQTAVAGSTRIGAGSLLCGQSAAREHIVLGERTTILARGFITEDTPPDSVYAGSPAMPAARWRKGGGAHRASARAAKRGPEKRVDGGDR
jgi:carbonic anhydrase/acetyltransferase-like protein (isoleucine patch superfamily)